MDPTSLQILTTGLIFLIALGILGIVAKFMMRPIGIAIALALLGWVMYLGAVGTI